MVRNINTCSSPSVNTYSKQPFWFCIRLDHRRVGVTWLDFKMFFFLISDLRQDMLTLQMIQLMENLWKKEGLDLR